MSLLDGETPSCVLPLVPEQGIARLISLHRQECGRVLQAEVPLHGCAEHGDQGRASKGEEEATWKQKTRIGFKMEGKMA